MPLPPVTTPGVALVAAYWPGDAVLDGADVTSVPNSAGTAMGALVPDYDPEAATFNPEMPDEPVVTYSATGYNGGPGITIFTQSVLRVTHALVESTVQGDATWTVIGARSWANTADAGTVFRFGLPSDFGDYLWALKHGTSDWRTASYSWGAFADFDTNGGGSTTAAEQTFCVEYSAGGDIDCFDDGSGTPTYTRAAWPTGQGLVDTDTFWIGPGTVWGDTVAQ